MPFETTVFVFVEYAVDVGEREFSLLGNLRSLELMPTFHERKTLDNGGAATVFLSEHTPLWASSL